MDPSVWNAYHIVSNRARSVCYATRQQQFRRQTEAVVNRLSSSTLEQLQVLCLCACNVLYVRCGGCCRPCQSCLCACNVLYVRCGGCCRPCQSCLCACNVLYVRCGGCCRPCQSCLCACNVLYVRCGGCCRPCQSCRSNRRR